MHIALFLAEALISDAKTSNDLKFDVKKLMYQLIKLKPTNTVQSKNLGYTLMHMACDANRRNYASLAIFGTKISYPNYTLVSLLLECGIEPECNGQS